MVSTASAVRVGAAERPTNLEQRGGVDKRIDLDVVDVRWTTSLFGLSVDALTMDESVERAAQLIESGRRCHHVCINAAKVVAMQRDPALREVLDHADMVSVDGQAVVWAARVLGAEVPERVAGIDLMVRLVERAAARGWRVYFLGATDEVLDAAVDSLTRTYPGLVVVGRRNGYWTAEEEADVVAGVAATSPDLVLVALPTPRKEFFVARHRQEFGAGLVVGVGGSFDVVAGHVRRAPLWMQRAGLEWFYRFLQEPRRMWKRYLVGNTRFLLLVARARIRGQKWNAPAKT